MASSAVLSSALLKVGLNTCAGTSSPQRSQSASHLRSTQSIASAPTTWQVYQSSAWSRVNAKAASDTTLSDVRKIIATQLAKDPKEVSADAKFVDLGADSLDTVEIMMALEEAFDISLDEEKAEKITTVQQAANFIEEQLAD